MAAEEQDTRHPPAPLSPGEAEQGLLQGFKEAPRTPKQEGKVLGRWPEPTNTALHSKHRAKTLCPLVAGMFIVQYPLPGAPSGDSWLCPHEPQVSCPREVTRI